MTQPRRAPRTETCPTCGSIRIFDTALYERVIEAEAATADDPMHTDEDYIEYGVVQYRRGRAQAEAEAAAATLDVRRAFMVLTRLRDDQVDEFARDLLKADARAMTPWLAAERDGGTDAR